MQNELDVLRRKVAELEDTVSCLRVQRNIAEKRADAVRELENDNAILSDDVNYLRGVYAKQCDHNNALRNEIANIRQGTKPVGVITPNHFGQMHSLLASGEKIQAVKLIRDVTGWGLKDAKEFVEAYWDLLTGY